MPDKFAYVKKGYDPQAVDMYIDALEIELKGHKEKSATINHAIVSAQQAADTIIKNAKNQGRTMKANTAKQIEDLTLAVASQKQWVSDFLEEYNAVVTKYLRPANSEDFAAVNEKIDSLEGFLRSFSEEINEDLEIEGKTDKQ